MKTINLRWMYPHYRHDEFVDVTDEVWAAMYQAKREMENYERRKVYHRAYYSLDAYSWLEKYALEHSRSPEDILLEREEMTRSEERRVGKECLRLCRSRWSPDH